MGLKHAPVVIQLYPKEVHHADLLKELRINKHDLDREILKQAGTYAWWAALYSEVAAKVELLEMRLDELEGHLALKYTNRMREKKSRFRVSDVKHYIVADRRHHDLQRRLWKWKKAEKFLKYSAVRGFEQRKDLLQTYCANQRREQDSEPKTRRRHESAS